MSTELASLSNQFVYAAMSVFALAFVAFAVSIAAVRTSKLSTPAVAKVPVSVGATGTETPTVEPSADEPGRKAGNIGLSLSWVATILLLLGVVLRGVSASRVPWGNMYEFSITAALAVALIYLIVSLKHDLRWLGVFVIGAVLLTLGLAVTVLYTNSAELVPALKSWWLVIHVSAAIICAGGFTLAAALSTAYLIRHRAETKAENGQPLGWMSVRMPSSKTLDRLTYRTIAFTFPLWTFAVIAGAIWAENAWGRYWGWDPKETWAFITWVVYAGYLHARATTGWSGTRTAIISLVGFLAFLFNYFGVNMFIPGLHSYAGI